MGNEVPEALKRFRPTGPQRSLSERQSRFSNQEAAGAVGANASFT